MLSCVQLFVTLSTVAYQVPLRVVFFRQECWRGLLSSLPGDLPDPGIETISPALAGRFFTTEIPCILYTNNKIEKEKVRKKKKTLLKLHKKYLGITLTKEVEDLHAEAIKHR